MTEVQHVITCAARFSLFLCFVFVFDFYWCFGGFFFRAGVVLFIAEYLKVLHCLQADFWLWLCIRLFRRRVANLNLLDNGA